MANHPSPEHQLISVDPIVYCIVFDANGRIRQSGACARSLLDSHAAHFGDGFAAMEVPDEQFDRDIDAKAYVLDGVILPKKTVLGDAEYTIRADGVNRVRFAVPAGTSVVHAGEIVAIEDGVFEFTTDVLGDQHFSFIAPAAFYDFEVTIHAV